MIIAIGCDHAGFSIKAAVIKMAESLGHQVLDVGTFSCEPVDYPDYAAKVATAVVERQAQRGIICCGSGIGACIAANKFKGARACVAHDLYSAAQGVRHDDMNILCLGGRVVQGTAPQLAEQFLSAHFERDAERHVRRLEKVLEIEAKNFK